MAKRGVSPSPALMTSDLKVYRRGLPLTLFEFKTDRLPLDKAAQTGRLDGGCMDEHVLAAAGGLNELISFVHTELLHGALHHSRPWQKGGQ